MIELYHGLGYVSLYHAHPDPLQSIVDAARTSTTPQPPNPEKDKKLDGYLWPAGHTSPYRHAHYTFTLRAPMYVLRQMWKHQVGSVFTTAERKGDPIDIYQILDSSDKGCSWNEESGRYKQFKPDFHIPEEWRGPVKGNMQGSEVLEGFDHQKETRIFRSECEALYAMYCERLKRGVCREQARMILPSNLMVSVTWTLSLQALRHMLALRTDDHTQLECQELAKAMEQLVKEHEH